MEKKTISWKIGGEAGFGIMNSGMILAKISTRQGFHVFTNTEYPSLIRGGYNTYQVMISEKEVKSHTKRVDILLALNQDTIDKDGSNLSSDAIIICGEKDKIKSDFKVVRLDWEKILKEEKASAVMKNMIGVAASLAVIGIPFKEIENSIKNTFGKKGKEIVEKNIAVAKRGYEQVKKQKLDSHFKIKGDEHKRMLLDGNEAISMGAIKAGCKMISAYPMTPASTIMEFMGRQQRKYDIVVKQAEDEIASALMAIGANAAGIRAMTATSGGGFSLMNEALGLAGMTETPLVVVNAQRGGPSTGLPTKMEQSDLRFVIHAGQGEFPRAIIAPGDIRDCFKLTFEAFNIAEKYQMPVIILTDKNLADRNETVQSFLEMDLKIDRGKLISKISKDYKRFQITKDGVSFRVLPGTKGARYVLTGNEHDETGKITEDPTIRQMMVDKRMKKLDTLRDSLPKPEIIGPKTADLTIVSWGSTKGVIDEALGNLLDKGYKVNFLQIKYIWPLQSKEISKIMQKANKLVLIEHNSTAQLGGIIRQETKLDFDYMLLKYDGFPYLVEDLEKELEKILKK